jgi:catechol 2,3-dioxygenase-like lactoylglutathione lyase family enzyme
MHAGIMPNGRWALHFGGQKINLQQIGADTDPLNLHPSPGSCDFCLVLETPLEVAVEQLSQAGVPIVDGPATRTGAKGPLRSIYIYDPDENLVELSNPAE